MVKTLIAFAGTVLIVVLAVGLRADEREGHEYEQEEHETGEGLTAAPTQDPGYNLYRTECGSCHLAYPAAMLPAPSWQLVMASLADHFGDNAELDPGKSREIGEFLARHAAAPSRGNYAERTWRATRDRTPPMRITQTDYFRGQHHEIPGPMVAGNPEVGSFSRCEACHTRADQGIFDEHEVRIPGHGRWDD